jgi:hypothetical protein
MDMKDAQAVLGLLADITATFERRAADPRFGGADSPESRGFKLGMEQAARTVRFEVGNGNLDLAAYLDIDPADLGKALEDATTRAQAEYERYSG